MKKSVFKLIMGAFALLASASAFGSVAFHCEGRMSYYSGGVHGGEWNSYPAAIVVTRSADGYELDLEVDGMSEGTYLDLNRSLYRVGGSVGGADVVAYDSYAEGRRVSLYTSASQIGQSRFQLRGNIQGRAGWPHYAFDCVGQL